MKRSMRDRWWVGIPLIAVGAIILFRQLGYDIDIGYIFRTYWPLFLIWWGVKGVTEIRRNGGYALIGPVIVLAIGGYFLSRNLGWIDYSMGEFIRYLIPIMLIGGGLFVLIGPRRRDRKHQDKMQPPPPPEPYQPLSSEDLEMPSSFDEQFEKTFGKPKQEPKTTIMIHTPMRLKMNCIRDSSIRKSIILIPIAILIHTVQMETGMEATMVMAEPEVNMEITATETPLTNQHLSVTSTWDRKCSP